MRFSLAILAVAAASASASLVSRQLPDCALPCLQGPGVDLDGCAPNDNACLCKSKTFVSKSTACITGACKGDQLQAALTLAQQLCAAVGVTLTSTPTGVPSQTSSASTATNTAPTSAPSSSAPSSGTGTGTGSSTAQPAQTSNSARSNTAGALAGMAAFGLAALAL